MISGTTAQPWPPPRPPSPNWSCRPANGGHWSYSSVVPSVSSIGPRPRSPSPSRSAVSHHGIGRRNRTQGMTPVGLVRIWGASLSAFERRRVIWGRPTVARRQLPSCNGPVTGGRVGYESEPAVNAGSEAELRNSIDQATSRLMAARAAHVVATATTPHARGRGQLVRDSGERSHAAQLPSIQPEGL